MASINSNSVSAQTIQFTPEKQNAGCVGKTNDNANTPHAKSIARLNMEQHHVRRKRNNTRITRAHTHKHTLEYNEMYCILVYTYHQEWFRIEDIVAAYISICVCAHRLHRQGINTRVRKRISTTDIAKHIVKLHPFRALAARIPPVDFEPSNMFMLSWACCRCLART